MGGNVVVLHIAFLLVLVLFVRTLLRRVSEHLIRLAQVLLIECSDEVKLLFMLGSISHRFCTSSTAILVSTCTRRARQSIAACTRFWASVDLHM